MAANLWILNPVKIKGHTIYKVYTKVYMAENVYILKYDWTSFNSISYMYS